MFAHFADAQEASEDTNDNHTQSASYVVAFNPPQTLKFALRATLGGWCVEFIQRNGFAEFTGNAETWVRYVNSDSPRIGGVVILDEGYWGHLALIEDFDTDSIDLVEQNYVGRGIVSRRTIPRDYSKILGFVVK